MPREMMDFIDLSFGDFKCIYTTYRDPLPMNFHHDMFSFTHGFVKHRGEHIDHKIHGGVIVVVHEHFVHRWLFGSILGV